MSTTQLGSRLCLTKIQLEDQTLQSLIDEYTTELVTVAFICFITNSITCWFMKRIFAKSNKITISETDEIKQCSEKISVGIQDMLRRVADLETNFNRLYQLVKLMDKKGYSPLRAEGSTTRPVQGNNEESHVNTSDVMSTRSLRSDTKNVEFTFADDPEALARQIKKDIKEEQSESKQDRLLVRALTKDLDEYMLLLKK